MILVYYTGCVLGILILALLICGIVTQYFPVIEHYEVVSDRLVSDQRVVLLTDLHGCKHGENNQKLIKMIKESEPDHICIAGDMTIKRKPIPKDVVELMRILCTFCHVYYAPGNHEIELPEYDAYKYELRKLGVHYLENDHIPIDGNIMIYGLDLSDYWYHKIWEKREFTEEQLDFLLGECQAGYFSLLLAHNPEYAKQYAAWGADLTLSGHIHGGIMRLPYLGGVISPSLRLFPKYDAGKFSVNGKMLIISRGLGLHHIKLRFFNRPEISVINLTCQKPEK